MAENKTTASQNIKAFLKKEIVLSVSFVLAVASMIAVPPDAEYKGYVHWTTLSILLTLMLVMSGLKALGAFALLGRRLLGKCRNARMLVLVLIGLCLCLAPFITNDVSLITFVPFTIFVLEYAGLEKYLIPTLSLETIAAHMGSMLTPIGNPHNIYYYGLMQARGETGAAGFILMMLPYFVMAGVLLVFFAFVVTRTNEPIREIQTGEVKAPTGEARMKMAIYAVLFIVSLLPVFGLAKHAVAAVIVVAAIVIFDKKTLFRTDYSLLFTFIFLFILVGNLGRIDALNAFLTRIVAGHELTVSVLASQIISNVPASILLSGFSDKYFVLALGCDIGGLGTLIASMANLISFKKYSEIPGARPGKYIAGFTVSSTCFSSR